MIRNAPELGTTWAQLPRRRLIGPAETLSTTSFQFVIQSDGQFRHAVGPDKDAFEEMHFNFGHVRVRKPESQRHAQQDSCVREDLALLEEPVDISWGPAFDAPISRGMF